MWRVRVGITFRTIWAVHIVHWHGSSVLHVHELGIHREIVLRLSFLNTSIEHRVDVLRAAVLALLRKHQGLPVFVKLAGLSRGILVAYDALKARLFQHHWRIIIFSKFIGLERLPRAEFADLDAPTRVENLLDSLGFDFIRWRLLAFFRGGTLWIFFHIMYSIL